MTSIIINNEPVDFGEITITFKFENPLFSEYKINAGYTYGIDLPNTQVIRKKLQHVCRINIIDKESEYAIKIYYKGIKFIDGLVNIEDTDDGFISLNIVSEGTDLFKLLKETQLKEYSFPSYEVCDASDSILDKIAAWHDYVTQNSVVESPTEGTHKFPMIVTDGYSDENRLHIANKSVVNPYADGEFRQNYPVPVQDDPKEYLWPYTFSPCIRAQYLLTEMLKQNGISSINGELEEITEFQQMTIFSGRVLDKMEMIGGEIWNWHGTGFNLADFVPDCDSIEMLTLLWENFGIYSVVDGVNIYFFKVKSMLDKPARNMTKFAYAEYSKSPINDKYYRISYQIEDSRKEDFMVYLDEAFLSSIPITQKFYPFEIIHFPILAPKNFKTIQQKHLPMKSQVGYDFGLNGFYDNFPDYVTDMPFGAPGDGFGPGGLEISSRNKFDGKIWSDEKPGDSSKTMQFVLLRGINTTHKFLGYVIDHLWSCNFRTPLMAQSMIDQMTSLGINISHAFGDTDMYLNMEEGVFNHYLIDFYQFLAGSRPIKKRLILPPHEIKEILSWRNPKHRIEHAEGNFEGIIKELTFSITADAISPVDITYLVSNNNL